MRKTTKIYKKPEENALSQKIAQFQNKTQFVKYTCTKYNSLIEKGL